MLGGGDGATVSMFGKSVWAAAEGADQQGGGAAATVDVVAKAMAPGALGEERAADERLD